MGKAGVMGEATHDNKKLILRLAANEAGIIDPKPENTQWMWWVTTL